MSYYTDEFTEDFIQKDSSTNGIELHIAWLDCMYVHVCMESYT